MVRVAPTSPLRMVTYRLRWEVVDGIECWGTDFSRVYYSDNQSFEPTEGDVSLCAYGDPQAVKKLSRGSSR